MNPPPRISVLLTTFNGETYLRPQIDSILNQTHDTIELIAVDDGSTDATLAILAEYVKSDPRVKLRSNGSNSGQSIRLYEAFKLSTSDFIAISDQDDVWHTRKLERLLQGLQEATMAIGPSRLIDAEGNDLGTTILDVIGAVYDPACRLSALFRPLASAHGLLVRRAGFSTTALQRRIVPFDWLMSLDAMYSSGLVYIEDAVVYHRLHGLNQINGGSLERTLFPNARKWKLSPWQVRQGLRRVTADRIAFLTCLDHIATSHIAFSAARTAFRRAYDYCYYAWFGPWRPLFGGAPALEHSVHAELLPFSGSKRDEEYFRMKFRRLLHTPPHPKALGAFIQRWGRSNDYGS